MDTLYTIYMYMLWTEIQQGKQLRPKLSTEYVPAAIKGIFIKQSINAIYDKHSFKNTKF